MNKKLKVKTIHKIQRGKKEGTNTKLGQKIQINPKLSPINGKNTGLFPASSLAASIIMVTTDAHALWLKHFYQFDVFGLIQKKVGKSTP